MNSRSKSQDRNELLAEVADLYYLQNKNQAEIAKEVGVTRSMISRMLTEARQAGIVQVRIERPLQFDRELSTRFAEVFGLVKADVIVEGSGESLRIQLGRAGARILKEILTPDMILGLPWGTTINAVVMSLQVDQPIPVKIVQLVGALGARNQDFDGHGVVQHLADKLSGQGFFLNAPFLGESQEIAQALLQNKGIRESLRVAEKCDVALLGIGTMDKAYSSFYNAGYIEEEDFQYLLDEEAVGDVCGLHFDIDGRPRAPEFQKRTVTIGREHLLQIPRRIGISGGPGKVLPILGAIRSGYVNQIVTNSATARAVLEANNS